MLHKISFRPAIYTVTLAFLLGISFSAIQLFIDLKAEKIRIDETVRQVIGISRESAIQAAVNLDHDLAEQVIKGLFHFTPIFQAEIKDNFGDLLATLSRSHADHAPMKWQWLAARIIDPEKTFTVDLLDPVYHDTMGSMTVVVDIHATAANFFNRITLVIIGDLLRSFILALILLAIFQSYLTKPLLAIISSLAKIVPGKSDKVSITVGKSHQDDELGMLVGTINSLLGGFDLNLRQLMKAEKELRASEERIRLLLESSAEAIFGLDLDGRCTFVNPSCLRMLGYESPVDLLGKNMHALLFAHKSAAPGSPNGSICGAVKNGCGIHEADGTMRRADDSTFPVEYWAHPIIRQGKTIGCVVTFLDISERKKSEAENKKLCDQLRQSQKMEAIGTLAGGIAHDFNNMLNAILGYSSLIMADNNKDTPCHEYADNIHKAGCRAAKLVEQILTFSRRKDEEKGPLQIQSIVKEALKLLKGTLPSTIELRESINSKCRPVMADSTQIHQVVMNLCTNAYHAMRETGGVLAVELDEVELDQAVAATISDLAPGNYVRLTVRDNGPGMDGATRERIFEPYFSTKKTGGGTGLGLATVHGIVKDCKGGIVVESAPGHGASFNIYLPVIVECILPKVEPQVDERSGPIKIHVLLVDDMPANILLGKTILNRIGCRVTSFTSSLEAFDKFRAAPEEFDLVITDQTMPRMTGNELAMKVLAIRADMPIIMITGYSDIMDEESAKAIGIKEFIMKPITPSVLAKAISKVLPAS